MTHKGLKRIPNRFWDSEMRSIKIESGLPSLGTDMRQGRPRSHDPRELFSAGGTKAPFQDLPISWKPPSHASSLSESDHEDVDLVGTAGSARPSKSRGHADRDHLESSSDDTHATDGLQECTVQQVSIYDDAIEFGINRASTSLLQLMSYRPNAANSTQWNRLISTGPDGSTRPKIGYRLKNHLIYVAKIFEGKSLPTVRS